MTLRTTLAYVLLPAYLLACGSSGSDPLTADGEVTPAAKHDGETAPSLADAGSTSGGFDAASDAASDAATRVVTDAGSTSSGLDGASDAAVAPGPTADGGVRKRIIAYYTDWSVYARNFQPVDVNASLLTHVNYAFANVTTGGQCILGDAYADVDKFYPGDSWDPGALRGAVHQWQLIRQRTPGLKLLLSVGGWTWSRNFSDAALTATSRTIFAQSCAALAARYGFDGLDIDWEYPGGGGEAANVSRPADRQNFTLLLQALRLELTLQGQRDQKSYLLSAALSGSPSLLGNLELAAAAQALDWVNLMTYDYHGGWETRTGMNAPLYAQSGDPSPEAAAWNVNAAVQYAISSGVPRGKIQPGVAFYGRGWSGVAAANDGLFQTSSGLPTGTWEQGVFDYKDLVANYIPSMTRHWATGSQVPWLYDAARRIFISYDDPQSLRAKAEYVNAQNLGGVMLWELSSDTVQHDLLRALAATLRP